MKIVFPIFSLPMSGGTRITLLYASGLAKLGHDVVLVSTDTSVDYFELPKNVSIQPVRIAPWVHRYLGYLASVVILGKAIPPCDIIFSNSWQSVYPAIVSQISYRRNRIVHLIQGLDSDINAGRPWPIRLRNMVMVDFVLRLPVQKIVVSSWLQRFLAEKYQQPSICIPNGIDLAAFTGGRDQSWSPPQEHFDVLCLGRAVKEKGFQDVVQAVRELASQDPCVRLIVATREELELPNDYPTILRRPENDIQLGELYRTCSVFVLPSWSDGFGLPALEAMACGAPVIVTDCGGISDFARDGDNCLIVPPKQPTQLSNAIRRLRQDKNLACRLAHNGKHTAQNFTIEKVLRKLEVAIGAE